jgi:hypothetical protein
MTQRVAPFFLLTLFTMPIISVTIAVITWFLHRTMTASTTIIAVIIAAMAVAPPDFVELRYGGIDSLRLPVPTILRIN